MRTEIYPSDSSKERFDLIAPLLEQARRKTKPRTVDLYEVFCAVSAAHGLPVAGVAQRLSQVAHSAFVLCQVERSGQGWGEPAGAGFKKIRWAQPTRHWGAAPQARS